MEESSNSKKSVKSYPMNPDAPRAKTVKIYPMPSPQPKYFENEEKGLYKIHEDFFVETSNYELIKKNYTNSKDKS